ncbi:MAG: nicotinate phosphoribosyltransferase [Candidatus Buchananbacteria bacterium]
MTGQEKPSRISPLLTDFYQISMLYTYWKTSREERYAVFDLFYRTAPFGGQYAVFAGLSRILDYLSDFCLTPEEIRYLKSLPVCSHYEPEFFDWFNSLKMKIKVWAPEEGTLMFPRVPLVRVAGPICVAQLIETTLLNLTNYATQIATNAARMRYAAGWEAVLMEFALRRAPGPDGAISASHYALMGGFNSTSDVLAGLIYDLPVGGTHAHSFVTSYTAEDLSCHRLLTAKDGKSTHNLTTDTLHYQKCLKGYFPSETNQGELAAFIDYAWANPERFLALIDTYNVETSGLPNYLAVALALAEYGYTPLGVRLDSGDLAYLSNVVYNGYERIQKYYPCRHCDFTKQAIVASNDIDEAILWSFSRQKHHITHFGIGTRLANCPALGGVYKLVQIDDRPVIKLSMNSEKMTIPGAKRAIRLYGADGKAILDLLVADEEYDEVVQSIRASNEILCRDPVNETVRCKVKPATGKELHQLVFFNGQRFDSLAQGVLGVQAHVKRQFKEETREDHLRPENPTPFKVAVTELVYQQMHALMASEAPIPVLS